MASRTPSIARFKPHQNDPDFWDSFRICVIEFGLTAPFGNNVELFDNKCSGKWNPNFLWMQDLSLQENIDFLKLEVLLDLSMISLSHSDFKTHLQAYHSKLNQNIDKNASCYMDLLLVVPVYLHSQEISWVSFPICGYQLGACNHFSFLNLKNEVYKQRKEKLVLLYSAKYWAHCFTLHKITCLSMFATDFFNFFSNLSTSTCRLR